MAAPHAEAALGPAEHLVDDLLELHRQGVLDVLAGDELQAAQHRAELLARVRADDVPVEGARFDQAGVGQEPPQPEVLREVPVRRGDDLVVVDRDVHTLVLALERALHPPGHAVGELEEVRDADLADPPREHRVRIGHRHRAVDLVLGQRARDGALELCAVDPLAPRALRDLLADAQREPRRARVRLLQDVAARLIEVKQRGPQLLDLPELHPIGRVVVGRGRDGLDPQELARDLRVERLLEGQTLALRSVARREDLDDHRVHRELVALDLERPRRLVVEHRLRDLGDQLIGDERFLDRADHLVGAFCVQVAEDVVGHPVRDEHEDRQARR